MLQPTGLKIDEAYAKKYDGSMISKKECDIITEALRESNGNYLDFSDSIKYIQLKELSEFFGMDLFLYSLRMPLSTLKAENKDGLLHYVISESNHDYCISRGSLHLHGQKYEKPHDTFNSAPFQERVTVQNGRQGENCILKTENS